MARRLTPAKRAELSVECYRLSLQGHSIREVARRVGVDHKTASRLIHEEAERNRAEKPNHYQKALDSHRQAVKRCWDELDRNPSPHSAAMLLNALNNALVNVDLITGVRASARLQADVNHHVTTLTQGIENLSPREMDVLEALIDKVLGDVDPNTPVLERMNGEILELEAGE